MDSVSFLTVLSTADLITVITMSFRVNTLPKNHGLYPEHFISSS